MSRQDKATTERNARILRDLVKLPDNKSCADCRKNDARWASWNLGVFLCIRCSGIHRSMGTHISKVKSIDLDIWTPEQLQSMQKWGNRRANMYWEKHLKAGHVPPDHKIESFIRSKYESRRWAMDGPPPRDPAELENGGNSGGASASAPAIQSTATASAAPPVPASLPKTHPLLSRSVAHAKASTPAAKPTPAPIVDLFGSDDTPTPSYPAPTHVAAPGPTQPPSLAQEAAAPQPTSAASAAPTGSSIFDLDFRAPSASSSQAANSRPQTAKADIMSLFSSPSPAASALPGGGFFNAPPTAPVHAQSPYANWGGGVTSSAPPVQQNLTQAPVPTTTVGSGTTQGWGGLQMDQSAWGTTPQPSQPQIQATAVSTNANPWGGNPAASPAADPWASTGGGGAGAGAGEFFGASQPPVQAKKDDRDPFANIWG